MKVQDCFYIGYITKTKGLKGEIQIYFEYDQPDLLQFDTIFIELNTKLVPYFISSYKLQSNQTGTFFLEDVHTIEKAEVLINKRLFLPNSKKLEQEHSDELLLKDLKGFVVHDKKYGELGEIVEVLEYPQQFIAVVPYKFREIMFPLNDEIILSVDENEGIVAVSLPEGLLEVYLNS